MITVLRSDSVWDPRIQKFVEKFVFAGLSKDTKPTMEYGTKKIANASSFFVIDTGEVHSYDEETGTWYKGTGGGGGGDDDRPATDEEIDDAIEDLDDL